MKLLLGSAGGSATFNFLRALRMDHALDIDVIGMDNSCLHLALSPIVKKYVISSVFDSEEDYIKHVNHLIETHYIDFLHVQSDVEVLAIAKHRTSINAELFLPNLNTILLCQDKWATYNHLKFAGIPVPGSWLIDFIINTEKLAEYGKLWIRARKGAGSRAALPVTSKVQLHGWLDYWSGMGISENEFMGSEYLPGTEYAWQSIWLDGQLITSATRERVEYLFGNLMPSGQSSSPSIATTVHNGRVNDICTKAIRAIDPVASGVFCVDLKENSSGTPCVTEINAGRFFTTSDFFAQLDANMPATYVRIASGMPLSELSKLSQYNAAPAGFTWVRLMDMGYKLLPPGYHE